MSVRVYYDFRLQKEERSSGMVVEIVSDLIGVLLTDYKDDLSDRLCFDSILVDWYFELRAPTCI